MLITGINLFSAKNTSLNTRNVSTPRIIFKNQVDTVSFSSNKGFKNVHTPDEAEQIATILSNSTSGVRRKYDDKFRKDVALLTEAIAAKLIADKASQYVMAGGDMRYASKILVPQFAKQMKDNGFTVFYIEQPVPTPALALAAKVLGVGIANLNTASHNKWDDAGFNVITKAAAVADKKFTEPLIPLARAIAEGKPVQTKTGKIGQIISYDPYPLYKEYLDTKEINGHKIIDFKAIKDAGIDILYDDFGGTGSFYFPRLLEDHGIEIAESLRTYTDGPEPNAKNMQTLADAVKNYNSELKIGLANDGDSDRFGIVDEQGNFIPANDVLLLAAYHLNKNKGYKTGAILRSAATTSLVDLLAKKIGLEVIETPTGFKYIGEKMIELENEGNMAVLGGEESGGLTIGGHIPEKDGFIATLLMAELMAMEKKPLSEIRRHIKEDIIGTIVENYCTNYAVANKHKFLSEFAKMHQQVLAGERDEIFGIPVDRARMIKQHSEISKFKKGGDGVKIIFKNGSSILVRLSGTEDKARVFKEIYSDSPEEAEALKQTIEAGVGAIAAYYDAKPL